jgi:uncharacterized protein
MLKLNPNSHPWSQLSFIIFLSLASMMIFLFLSIPVAKMLFGPIGGQLDNLTNLTDPNTLKVMQYYQLVQSIALFIIPPFIFALLYSTSVFEFLNLNTGIEMRQGILIVFILFSAIPFINLLSAYNEQITLPASMAGIEAKIKAWEAAAAKQTEAFLGLTSKRVLYFNIFMVALVPAIGEELMFRGVLQKIFSRITKNAHWGIILSGFLFSAVHFQFYGFIPRMLLGMLFGYLLFWSGSIWAPILAHFINNALAVIGYYMVNTGQMKESTLDIGATKDVSIYTLISTLFFFAGCYYFYKISQQRKEG